VLNAEKDWGLDRQARHFVEKLKNAGVKCEWKQYIGSGTNHLSIIGLAKGLGEPYKHMIHDSINFLQELVSYYHHETAEHDPGSVVDEPVVVESLTPVDDEIEPIHIDIQESQDDDEEEFSSM
jgi:hypothetical protein